MPQPQPVRVGIVGCNRQGRYVVERLLLRGHCELTVFQTDAGVDSLLPGNIAALHTNWHRFLSDPEMKAVLFLDGPAMSAEQLQSALESGRPVGALPPLNVPFGGETSDGLEGRQHFSMIAPYRDDSEFLAARRWVETNPPDGPAAIKRISWVPDLIPESEPGEGWWMQCLWEDADQLLLLAGESPVAIYALPTSRPRREYFVVLTFESGLTAHLERRRGAQARLEIGWSISSGLAHGKSYVRTSAGEIYPVNAPSNPDEETGLSDILESVFQPSPENSWVHAKSVSRVLQAVEVSLEERRIVEMSEI